MILLLPLILLIAGAYLAFLVGKYGSKDSNSPAIITTIFSFLALIVSAFLAWAWVELSNGVTEFQGFNIIDDLLTYTLGSTEFMLEPLGAFLMLVATALTFIVSIYSIGYMKNEPRKHYFFPLMSLMIAGIVGIAISTDLFML
jgi:NADH-quinone oxidoreductase subunit L